jgi:mRNA interferase RelE/StbE
MYKIQLSTKAVKFLFSIPKEDKEKIDKRIASLAEIPRGADVKKLVNNEQSIYRIRQGIYRIFFQILDDKLLVSVIDIAKRKDCYR